MKVNPILAMNAARTNYAVECIKDGYDYGLYVSFMMQAVAEEYVEIMTVSPLEWEELYRKNS